MFAQVALLLSSRGFISLNVEYIDGTKIVWRKTVERNRERLMKKIHVLLEQIDDAIARENSPESDEEIAFTPAMLTEMAGEFAVRLNRFPNLLPKRERPR